MNDVITQISIKNIFNDSNDTAKRCNYVIPIYQRNYAWHKTHIFQLIQDIYDYYESNTDKPYYIGTLIVFEKKESRNITYDLIDGQQRFTTITLLLSALKNHYKIAEVESFYTEQKLQFECRDISSRTLEDLFLNTISNYSEYDEALMEGYNHIIKGIDSIVPEIKLGAFVSYLINKVTIFRVLVPEDTDLNHYFEIMNSRGEQLEKHEILKSYCLHALNAEDRFAFSYIWEACSTMEEYVQIQFEKNIRFQLFGLEKENELNKLVDLDSVYKILLNEQKRLEKTPNVNETSESTESDICQSISDLLKNGIKGKSPGEPGAKEDTASRFNSVLTFSNFLLLVLKIQTKSPDVKLDDKRLLQFFEQYLQHSKTDEGKKETEQFVKAFGYNILKCKFLYDKFIIKRENKDNKEKWSLKKLKYYKEPDTFNYINTFGYETETEDSMNHRLIMILSMFHVSTPTQVYKHWLYASLKYLFHESDISEEKYLKYLENLAKAYFFDRFISIDESTRNYETIIDNNGIIKNTIDNCSFHLLNNGTKVENFVFNYLDYLLWRDYQFNKKWFNEEKLKRIRDPRISKYEFGFRSSVEHYYPQQPNKEAGFSDLKKEYLDCFGNLCLLSSSKNSRLSNLSPKQKKDFYFQSETIDSIKQCLMMDYNNWWEDEIKEHGSLMNEILLEQYTKDKEIDA